MSLGAKMGNIIVMVGLLLVMVPKTMQLATTHPLHHVVESLNAKNDPFLGFVLSSESDESRLLKSGYFQSYSDVPHVVIAGRQFNIGTFKGVPSIYVVARSPLAYVSATVQILVDTFNVKGIIDYGSAGIVSDSLDIADVAVLSASAFTGVWNWKDMEEESLNRIQGSLNFGDFNYPKPGENKLGSIDFQYVKHYTPNSSTNKIFWHRVHQDWLHIASQIKDDVTLDKCMGDSICVSKEPKVVSELRGSSSDALLSNQAYGRFLNQNFHVSTVDRKSAATISTANANGVKSIVFRAATNKPGEPYDDKLAYLGGNNSLKVVAAFVDHLTKVDEIARPHFNNHHHDARSSRQALISSVTKQMLF